MIILPILISGVKEHLIKSSGELFETSSSTRHSDFDLPFITETNVGQLKCQKLLFVNWTFPNRLLIEQNNEYLIQSIRFFLSKIFQYSIRKQNEKNQSEFIRTIAIAMPDPSISEDILADEFIKEIIYQMNSFSSIKFHISLIFTWEQNKFYQEIYSKMQRIQSDEKYFGIFYCPSTGKNREEKFDFHFSIRISNSLNSRRHFTD